MNTVDMLIHVRPELDIEAQHSLERSIEHHIGVDCAEFVHQPHTHTMVVKYDPDMIEGQAVLNAVRTFDPEATRVGL